MALFAVFICIIEVNEETIIITFFGYSLSNKRPKFRQCLGIGELCQTRNYGSNARWHQTIHMHL